jgi:hypothetical protein
VRTLSAIVASIGGARLERSTSALPSPETPSFNFTTACAIEGRAACIFTSAAIASSMLPRLSNPSG